MKLQIQKPVSTLPKGRHGHVGGGRTNPQYTEICDTIISNLGQWVPVVTPSPANAKQVRMAVWSRLRRDGTITIETQLDSKTVYFKAERVVKKNYARIGKVEARG